MNEKIIRFPAPIRKPRREYRDDTPVGIKMDTFKLRVLMLKALAELVIDIDEERRQS